MNGSQLLDGLKQLGFSEYEAKCYLALFERESLTVSDISKLAGIPRSNAYESMERLQARGLSVSIPGKMKKYAASDPWLLREKSLEGFNLSMEAELEALERRRKEILEMKIKEMLDRKKAIQENIDNVAAKLEALYKGSRSNGSPLDYIEVFKEPYQILRKYVDLMERSTRQIVVFSKPPYSFSNKKQQDEQEECVVRALQRGVKVRSIYEIPTVPEERARIADKIRLWSGKGEGMRWIDNLPLKLAIFDESFVLLPLEDIVQGKTSLTALVAEHHALAKGLMFLFESFWEKARSIETNNPLGKKGKRKGSGPAH